jgi:hypothetical protein
VVVVIGAGTGAGGTGIEISPPPLADEEEPLFCSILRPSNVTIDLSRLPKIEWNPKDLPLPLEGVEGEGLWYPAEGDGDCDEYPESLDSKEVALPALSREFEPCSSMGISKGCKAPVIRG